MIGAAFTNWRNAAPVCFTVCVRARTQNSNKAKMYSDRLRRTANQPASQPWDEKEQQRQKGNERSKREEEEEEKKKYCLVKRAMDVISESDD